MPLFGPPRDPENEARNRRSQEQLARGGLPLNAEARLATAKSRPGFFTSSLSVNEFVLGVDDGLRPLGLVVGSSVFHVGWQYTPMYSSSELIALTHAHTQVRRLALGRLQQEAAHLGADGVTGVRLFSQRVEDDLLEFSATGTAFAFDPVPDSNRQTPFLSALSGQDLWTLRRAGYRPVGVTFGTCSFYCVASYTNQWASSSGLLGGGWAGNVELTDFSESVYIARHAAMSRAQADAARFGAEGIVGMEIGMNIRPWVVEINKQERRDLRVDFSALGTAVATQRDRWPVIDYSLPLSL